ncbi:MAG: T9SS type A sorting domain-containing protein [Saprospiraceae bacterium]|nr:T9SS type A sorting domain-containing protein [Saprospiraceae bacterium]
MKYNIKAFFTTLILWIYLQPCIFGQYQTVFGSSYTEWNYIALYCDAGIVESFVHERDTIIQNVAYKVINNFGFLRESDEQSRLWFRAFDQEDEVLLSDMNLNKGDTFSFVSTELIVDTTYLKDNRKIIEFDFTAFHCGYYEKLRFEEGKGVNWGFRFALSGLQDDTRLLRCLTRDSVSLNFLEDAGFGTDCREHQVFTEDENIDYYSVYPNPTSKWLDIKSGHDKTGNIEIFDHTGFKRLKLNNYETELPLDVEDWPNGIYFLKIYGKTNDSWIKWFKI